MKHIVMEANCFYDSDKKENESVPKCCKFGPNNISINCLKFNEGENRYCPFLVLGSARTTLVLTEQNGNAVNSDSFWGDLKLSEEDWLRKEKEWIEKQFASITI
ncbi:hypothetical protein CTM_19904, partial [Clostridium tetanomorphum DSM 665]